MSSSGTANGSPSVLAWIAVICLPLSIGWIDTRVEPPTDARAAQQNPDTLAEYLRDSQETNSAAFPSGRLSFACEFDTEYDGKLAIAKAEGEVSWVGTNALWIIRISDPSKIATSSFDWSGDLSSARTEYVLASADRIYWYNPYTNVIVARKATGDLLRDAGATYILINALPGTCWFKYGQPVSPPAMSWFDLIGRKSPAFKKNMTLTIERQTGGLIRQRRVQPDGVFEVTFSPDDCGNVIESTFSSKNPRYPNSSIKYEWSKTHDGRCVLRRCLSVRDGSADGKIKKYRWTISIDDYRDIHPNERPSFALLKSLVPENAKVQDLAEGRLYRLNPRAASADIEDTLIRLMRSRGFIKRGR